MAGAYQTKSSVRHLVSGLTDAAAGPREYHDAGDLCRGAEVHHPDGLFDVEVVEDGAAGEAGAARGVAVDRPRRVTVQPLTTHVPLPLTSIVDPRLLAVSHVLHCSDDSNNDRSG